MVVMATTISMETFESRSNDSRLTDNTLQTSHLDIITFPYTNTAFLTTTT